MTDTERIASALERIAAILERQFPQHQDRHATGGNAPSPEPFGGQNVTPATPAQAFAQQSKPDVKLATDECPVHHVEWRTTKSDGSPAARQFCSKKMPDGTYCNQKGAWLRS